MGLLISTPPGDPKTETALQMAKDALMKGQAVMIFLYQSGVGNLHHERYVKLLDEGATIYACSQSCQAQGINPIPEKVILSNLAHAVSLMSGCQQFVAFIA